MPWHVDAPASAENQYVDDEVLPRFVFVERFDGLRMKRETHGEQLQSFATHRHVFSVRLLLLSIKQDQLGASHHPQSLNNSNHLLL